MWCRGEQVAPCTFHMLPNQRGSPATSCEVTTAASSGNGVEDVAPHVSDASEL